MVHPWMEGIIVVSDVKVDSVGGEMSITLSPDRASYENGNKVNITGKILNYDLEKYLGDDIVFSLTSPADRILQTGQMAVNPDGSFTL